VPQQAHTESDWITIVNRDVKWNYLIIFDITCVKYDLTVVIETHENTSGYIIRIETSNNNALLFTAY